MPKRLFDSFLLAACLVGGAAVPALAGTAASSAHAVASKPVKVAAGAAAPAKPAQPAYNGPDVLDPSRFYGLAAVGYASAKAAPQVMSKLFCYCGCDGTDSHTSLLDCFTSPHGVDCHICQEEAVEALKLYRQGVPIADIQKQIDQQYVHWYPFKQETANYKAYKASRLWVSGDSIKTAGNSGPREHKDAAGPVPADNNVDSGAVKEATAPKLKPGFHAGNCCGGGKDAHK